MYALRLTSTSPTLQSLDYREPEKPSGRPSIEEFYRRYSVGKTLGEVWSSSILSILQRMCVPAKCPHLLFGAHNPLNCGVATPFPHNRARTGRSRSAATLSRGAMYATAFFYASF